jgi:hypothetical protein
MHYPAILFAVAIATCIINTVYAGSYYNPDHTTAPVTPGGFGVWSDAPLPPPGVLEILKNNSFLLTVLLL